MERKKLSFDKSGLNLNPIFCGKFDMPYVKSSKEIPADVITFERAMKTKNKEDYKKWIVFYCDDSEFERLWNSPYRYLNKLRKFKGVVTPDFSMYGDMPYPIKMMNAYRSKWLGVWFNENGIKTIINVRWSDEESLEYVLDGIEEGSNIFIGTLGARRNNEDRYLLEEGFKKVCDIVKPNFIMSYGTLTNNMLKLCKENKIPYKEYTPQISKIFMNRS